MNEIIDDIHNILTNVDFENNQEVIIQKNLLEHLKSLGYLNYKNRYVQDYFRVKNLGTAKADLILSDQTESGICIIEVKNQIDLKRASSRFERAFVDVAYLMNEVKESDVRGFLLYFDKMKTRYLDKNHFTQAVEKVLPITLQSDGWHNCNNGKWEYKLFEVKLIEN